MAFKTYNLSEDQLIKITRLCNQEQGTIKGCRAEASIMANLFEKQSKYKTLYDYVRNGGWFAKAAYHMDNGSYTTGQLTAVKDVLVNGNRFFPSYIDEHDCFSDLKSCTNYGVEFNPSDRIQYIKDVTVCKNVYGSTWTFYCFPDEKYSDPFGYTKKGADETEEPKVYEPKSIRKSICAYGDIGSDVAVLQSVLNYHFDCGLEMDGEFGRLTKNALISAQKTMFPNDSKQWDGVCGESTWEKLLD